MISIKQQINFIVVCATSIGLCPMLYVSDFSVWQKLGILVASSVFAFYAANLANRNIVKGLLSLQIGLQNFKDGEFSTSLSIKGDDEIQSLCKLYNETADKLRTEKQWLHQRELMLDKVLHSSPDVVLLVNDRQQVVFSNIQAKQFFASKQKLEGFSLQQLLKNMPVSVNEAVTRNKEGLFTLPGESGEVQTWHLATGSLLLNNQQHYLYVFKQMTRELNRQEVAVWKKVIRVISHELNNSLGPISSMLHSGQLLSQQQNDGRLERVFKTIEERIAHLNQFVQGYGKFAKLPAPTYAHISLSELLTQIKHQYYFTSNVTDDIQIFADQVQIEQLLINLLKNAHESGSPPQEIAITISKLSDEVVIEVVDRGKGMSKAVMANALVPFYSTKTDGSGLGLALCREIVDAHHGNMMLQNRQGQGLCVKIVLPAHP